MKSETSSSNALAVYYDNFSSMQYAFPHAIHFFLALVCMNVKAKENILRINEINSAHRIFLHRNLAAREKKDE